MGIHIRTLREARELSIEDVASMTGFARNTITAAEKGSNTDTSHLIEIAKAIGVHPMELLNVPFEIRPRFKLSPKRLDQNRLTLRLNKLSSTSFFDKPKLVSEVILHLQQEYEIKVNSTHASVVLKRLVSDGVLKYTKSGRQNNYSKRK